MPQSLCVVTTEVDLELHDDKYMYNKYVQAHQNI